MVGQLGQSGSFQTRFATLAKNMRVGTFYHALSVGAYLNVGADVVKIATLTFSTSSGDQTVTIEGVEIIVNEASDNDNATALAAAINGSFDATTGGGAGAAGLALNSIVRATAATNVVTITGLSPGFNFEISYSGTGGTLVQDGSGASQLAVQSAFIPYGRYIGFDSGDTSDSETQPCRTLNGAATRIIGISGGTAVLPDTGTEAYGYNRGDTVAALELGKGVAELDSAVSIEYGDPVYYRHSVDGSLDKIGAVTNAAGTGLAQDTRAQFVGVNYTEEGLLLALVERF